MDAGRFQNLINEWRNDPEYICEGLKLQIIESIGREMNRQGISRSELARRMQKPRPNITRLLSGNQNFSIMMISEIASALEVNVAFTLAPEKMDDSANAKKTVGNPFEISREGNIQGEQQEKSA